MPEHVHLLLSEPQRDTLAHAVKWLKQGVSRRLIGDAEHFLAKAVLRFQHSKLSAVRGEPALSSQNGRRENANELREAFVQQ